MQNTTIEWCDKTSNPIIGCGLNCNYCYARRINHRFKYIEDWNRPQFFEKELRNIIRLKPQGLRVFIGSMGDVFGNNIPSDWITSIIEACSQNWHDMQTTPNIFMFLTKNPKRYSEFTYPPNVVLGVTCESKDLYHDRIEPLQMLSVPNNKYVSLEPIQSDFIGVDFTGIHQVMIGKVSGVKDRISNQEYLRMAGSVYSDNIFLKDSIKNLIQIDLNL